MRGFIATTKGSNITHLSRNLIQACLDSTHITQIYLLNQQRVLTQMVFFMLVLAIHV